MGRLFYQLGRWAGPYFRKGKWLWQSLTGSEKDVIEAEFEVGCDLARGFRQELKLTDDHTLSTLVNDVGMRLVQRVRNKLRRFEFTVFSGAQPNAFALPGGFIFVTQSLVELVRRAPDQVAFILGHEIGHVLKEHARERTFSNAAIAEALRMLRMTGPAGSWLLSVGARLLQSAYSRDDELSADQLSVRLAVSAGYDPYGAIRMLENLKRATNAAEDGTLPAYFSSHPPLQIRIDHLNRLLRTRR